MEEGPNDSREQPPGPAFPIPCAPRDKMDMAP